MDLFVFGIGHIGSICITKILIPLFEYWIILDLFVFGGGYQQRWTGQKGIWQDYIHGLISCCLNTWHPQYRWFNKIFSQQIGTFEVSRYPPQEMRQNHLAFMGLAMPSSLTLLFGWGDMLFSARQAGMFHTRLRSRVAGVVSVATVDKSQTKSGVGE